MTTPVVMPMATSERTESAQAINTGIVPSLNGLVAAAVILGTYVTRYGVVYEGVDAGVWLLPLYLTTDLILPVLAAAWLLGLPTAMLAEKIR